MLNFPIGSLFMNSASFWKSWSQLCTAHSLHIMRKHQIKNLMVVQKFIFLNLVFEGAIRLFNLNFRMLLYINLACLFVPINVKTAKPSFENLP